MNTILKLIFGSSMASVLFFTPPTFKENNSDIIISGQLRGIVTEKVEKIINAGSEVRIIYYISIYAFENNKTILLKKKIFNSIKFDNLEDLYLLNLNGKMYYTGKKEDAYSKIGFYRAEFEKKSFGFSDFYVDASIEYKSSLKSDISTAALWEYYMPYQKIEGIIKFEKSIESESSRK